LILDPRPKTYTNDKRPPTQYPELSVSGKPLTSHHHIKLMQETE